MDIPKNVWDFNAGLARMGGSEKLLYKHMEKFRARCPEFIRDMKKLMDSSDYDEAAVLFHSVKGLSGMLGLTDISCHTQQAEHILKSNPDPSNSQKTEVYRLIHLLEEDIDILISFDFAS